MKVFISSVIAGLEPVRDAAARAARSLGHEVTRAEDFGASPNSPQQQCLAGVRWAEALVLLLGTRYGQPQKSGLSATHEEYREARDRCPVLAFVQEGVDREPEQQRFLAEVREWTAGHYTAHFRTPEDLRDAVTRGLHDLALSQAGVALRARHPRGRGRAPARQGGRHPEVLDAPDRRAEGLILSAP